MTYIDLHTHGLCGRDARSEDPEDYLILAASYKAHGTDAFLPTLFPGPVEEVRDILAAIKRAMELQAPGEGSGQGAGDQAEILGAHLEGPFINPERRGALPRDWFLHPTNDNLSRLLAGFEDVVKIATVAPELPGALLLIERLSGMGIRVNMGHSAATYAQAKDGAEAGATGVTHLFNAMSQMHHREPGLAGYALTDDRLYVELIADMAHVHPAAISMVLKCKPKDRVLLVSDSLREAKVIGRRPGEPIYMEDGRTLAGSGVTLSEAVENLVSMGPSRAEAELFASANPMAYLGRSA